MGRPYGLLRTGFPFYKTLGMRLLTNFPIDIALGKEGCLYILCRNRDASTISLGAIFLSDYADL